MNAINTSNTFSDGTVRLDTSRQAVFGKLRIGDIISGTLTENDGKKATVTMDNGKSFFVDSKSITAEIGQRISFEVADVHGNSVVMKQINDDKEEEIKESESADLTGEKLLNWAKGSVLPITGAAFASSKIMAEQTAEQNTKMLDALNRIKTDILHSINNVSGGAISLLAANGISVDNITVSMLTSAIRAAVAPLRTAEPSAEEVTAALESYSQNNNERENSNVLESITALIEEDLPPTDSNIGALVSACEKKEEASAMNAQDKISFLKNGREATLSNLFTAIHSAGTRKPVKNMPDAEWSEVRQSVEKYMASTGIRNNQENLEAARTLIANDIPVTKESVGFMTGGLRQRETGEIIRNAARNMAEGKNPLSVKLYGDDDAAVDRKRLFESYKEIISEFPKITDEALAETIDGGEPVTVAALINAQRQLSHNGGKDGSDESESNRRSPRFFTEKIKLEELRLRLTITAASQMSKAGISIDAMELQSAIDELKELERKNNLAALKIAGADATEQNAAEMSERAAKIRGLSGTHDSVKRGVMNREIQFTAEKLSEANEAAREKAAREGYEAVSTAPNAKFGDSLAKVLNQVENLLLSLGIEASPENVKAAKSLVRTGTDVNKDNIEAIKAINNKIEKVTQSLHPVVSASMIKDGFNPLAAHIDEVIAYIDRYNEMYGEPPVEAMEKAIFNMDKSGVLSKEERDSLIGMYRMLSAINRNETASSAVIAKSGKKLTLENLMESGKYYSKSGAKRSVVDRTADDSMAGREVQFSENSIREQLGRAYKNALRELEENGITEQQAVETAEANNLGLTAQNMDIMKSLSDNEMELSGLNLNSTENIRRNIEKLIEAVRDGGSLEYLKTLGDKLKSTDVRELLDGMNEFMENNSENDARLNMSEEAAFSAFKDDLKSLAGVTPQQLAWMMAMNLPLTINNLKTVHGMSGDREYLGKRLEELNRLAENIAEMKLDDEIPDTDLKQLAEGAGVSDIYDGISDKIDKMLDKVIETDSPDKVELLRKAAIVENAAKVMGKTGDNYYQIPVKLHDKIGSLNVYVLNKDATGNKMSAFIRLDMTELGAIQTSVNIEDGFADIVIGADRSGSLKLLEDNVSMLRNYIEEIGLDGYKISFKTEEFDYFESSATLPVSETKQQETAESGLDIRL